MATGERPPGTRFTVVHQVPVLFDKLEDIENNPTYDDAFIMESDEWKARGGKDLIFQANDQAIATMEKGFVVGQKFPTYDTVLYYIEYKSPYNATVYFFPESVIDQAQLDTITANNKWYLNKIKNYVRNMKTESSYEYVPKTEQDGTQSAYNSIHVYVA